MAAGVILMWIVNELMLTDSKLNHLHLHLHLRPRCL